jgi:hypothetical protein
MNHDQFGMFEEKPLEALTVSQLQNIIKEFKALRDEVDELEKVLKLKNEKLTEYKSRIVDTLTAHNMTSFKVDGIGAVSVVNKYQVSFPKDLEGQEKLRAYLAENGMVNMLTVNHQTLNSLFKSLSEEALEAGRSLSEVIPGVGEPKVFTTVSFRKG